MALILHESWFNHFPDIAPEKLTGSLEKNQLIIMEFYSLDMSSSGD
jgi:hypothetical protein